MLKIIIRFTNGKINVYLNNRTATIYLRGIILNTSQIKFVKY